MSQGSWPGGVSGPASISSTVRRPSSLKRPASAAPADPAPTMISSNDSISRDRARPSYQASMHHMAALVEAVLVIAEHLADDLVLQDAVLFHDARGIEILNREMVGVESEIAAHRVEWRLLERRDDRLLVADLAMHRLHRTVERHDRIIDEGG